jgi:hypothetical protein
MSPSNIEALEARIKEHEKEVYRHNCNIESLHEEIEREKKQELRRYFVVEVERNSLVKLGQMVWEPSSNVGLNKAFPTAREAISAILDFASRDLNYRVRNEIRGTIITINKETFEI